MIIIANKKKKIKNLLILKELFLFLLSFYLDK